MVFVHCGAMNTFVDCGAMKTFVDKFDAVLIFCPFGLSTI